MKNTQAFLLIVGIFSSIGQLGCVNEFSQPVPFDTAFVQKFKKIKVELTGVTEMSVTENGSTRLSRGWGLIIIAENNLLIWDSSRFMYSLNSKWHSEPTPPMYREDYTDGHSTTIFRDTLSSDNKISGYYYFSYSSYGKNHWGMVYSDQGKSASISYQSIPSSFISNDTLQFTLKGNALKPMLSNVSSSDRSNSYSSILKGIVWDTTPAPELKITLTK
jgi:hypothetical protein